MSAIRLGRAFLFCLALFALPAHAEEERTLLRYDLRPGDHLVYRQRLERESTSHPDSRQQVDFAVVVEWSTHLLVAGHAQESAIVGFQRNRTSAELLRYREGGEDRLAEEAPRFRENLLQSPQPFAEANWFTSRGEMQLPPRAVRESTSTLLPAIHELEVLPPSAVRPGDTWKAGTWYVFSLQATNWELVQDERCLKVEGATENDVLRLKYRFCPESGLLARLEFEGLYDWFGLRQVREKVSWELVERRRDEAQDGWLTDPEARFGALEAWLVSNTIPVEAPALYAAAEGNDPWLWRQVLALAYQRGLNSPPPETLAALLDNEDARVRTLAVRLLENVEKAAARPLVEKALADSDPFVRSAARHWVRKRLPEEKVSSLQEDSVPAAPWVELSEKPIDNPKSAALAKLAQAVHEGRTLPDWNCRDTAEWAEQAVRAQRARPSVLGFSVQAMQSGPNRGLPYAIYVPEDYRGDEAFPLLILLGGSGGRVFEGALSVRRTAVRQGYLVLVPEAKNQFWWKAEPAAIVADLLPEILSQFNVDPNRVYLTGFSNGGTGAFYFAGLWPYRFAAVSLLMGAGINVFTEPGPLLVNMSHLPLQFVHGDKDQQIPIGAMRNTVEALRELNPSARLEVHVLKGREHDIVLGTDDGLALPFLQKHVRDPFPRRLRFYTASLDYPRQYWVQILEKKEGIAGVEGTINDDNSIRVDTRNVTRLRLLLRRELLPKEGPVRVLLNGEEVFIGTLSEDCRLLETSWHEAADPFLAYSAELTFNVPD